MDVSVIIINWNSKSYVRDCVHSLYKETSGIRFEVIVLDNATRDGCGEMLAAEFPAARYIQSEENLGFARGNNFAAQQATGEMLLFLNPDTEVHGPALSKLHAAIKSRPDAGAVGARLLNSDGTLQTSCIQSFPTIPNQLLDSEFLRGCFPKSRLWGMAALFSDKISLAEAEAISGACIMMRRRVFEEIGGFSVDYFMYSEDIDLCYKARQRNFTNYHVPEAIITHHGDGSVRKAGNDFAIIMSVEALSRFFKKHRGAGYARLYRVGLLTTSIWRLVLLAVLRLGQFRQRRSAHSGSWLKWKAILRWGAGCERWVLKYR